MMNHGQKKASLSAFEELVSIKNMPDSLKKYELLLQVVPDDYAAWQKFFAFDPPNFLKINQHALQVNPKSYSAWHFRKLKTEENDENEDSLTKLLLKFDPRNFHCWTYRREKKLPLIFDYFNFSALHDLINRGIFIDFKSLIYTDPFYEGGYVFLLKNTNKIRIYDDNFIVSMERPIKNIFINGVKVYEPSNSTLIWKSKEILSKKDTVKVECENGVYTNNQDENDIKFIDEIIELEPMCKWPLIVKLRYTKNLKERTKLVEKLAELDPVRSKYYKALKFVEFIDLIKNDSV